MNHMSYSSFPSAKQFQSDSSVTFAFRKDDTILTQIDWLLARLEETPAKRQVILCDLFLTCNYWIKLYHEKNPRMLKERYPVVLALFGAVVDALASLLHCSRAKVAEILGEIYGRDMHTHGHQVDTGSKRARYYSKLEQEHYRVRFKGGLAYQIQWWLEPMGSKLVLTDSKYAYTPISRKNELGIPVEGAENYGAFIMTSERAIYMGKPSVGDIGSEEGIFHSSFHRGGLVTMAGTILIVNGQVRAVRADSGHYKPTEMNMALFLQALAMFGVNLHKVTLYSYDGADCGLAIDFLRARMSWTEFDKQRRAERKHRMESDSTRQHYGVDPKFPHLQKGPAFQRPVTNQPPQTVIVPTGNEEFYANAH